MGASSLVLYQETIPPSARDTSRSTRQNRSRALPPNISAVLAQKVSDAPIYSLGYDDARGILCEALRSAVANQNAPTKRLMRALSCNERTAENLYAGRNIPSGMVMLRAIAAFPEFAAAVRELTDRHADRDEMLERDIVQLIGTFMKSRDWGGDK